MSVVVTRIFVPVEVSFHEIFNMQEAWLRTRQNAVHVSLDVNTEFT